MKKRVTRRTTRRAVARGTARRANPRYKLILDGYDWASIPAFNKTEAVKRAKEIYPDKKGKWTAEKVDERMFIGQRERAEELENQLRLERKRARAAERASGPPSRARRNGGGEETRVYTRGAMNRITLRLQRVDRRYAERRGLPIGGDWLVSSDGGSPYYNEFRTLAEAKKEFLALASDLERYGYTLDSIKNGTHIHADMIDHLDVAKVHNPDFDSVNDVWAAISGERVINQSRVAPYGNYSSGLILEEYALPDGTYLQVALDPNIGNDPVDWAHTEASADDWLVG